MTASTPETPAHDENHLIAERRAKLAALRAQGVAYPNDFRRADYAGDLQAESPRTTPDALRGKVMATTVPSRLAGKS